MTELRNAEIQSKHRTEFEDIAACIADAYDFPELAKSPIKFTRHEDDVRDDCFPMKQVESRKPSFEFDENRFARFESQFNNMLSDMPVARRGLDRVASLLFIGTAVVRPIVQYELFEKHGQGNPRHIQALAHFYKDRKDISQMFVDIFGQDPEGPLHHSLGDEFTDENMMTVNGQRVSLSFLYGGLRRDTDKILFGELVADSREVIRTTITRNRDEYQEVGKHGLGSDIGDQLLLDTIPTWLLALSCPIRADSYGHLGSKIWQDRFDIDTTELLGRLPRELGGLSIDKPADMMPSAFTGQV